jgi:hypothetical protein
VDVRWIPGQPGEGQIADRRPGLHGIIEADVCVRNLPFVLLAVLAAACSGGIQQGAEVVESVHVSPSMTTTLSPLPSAAPAPSPSATSSSEPDRKPPIVVKQPLADAEALSPVVVSGTANVPSGTVAVRVLDAEGTELAAMSVDVSCGTACRGTFRAELAFFAQVEQSGMIEVSEPMPNGTQEHVVSVSVVLVPGV